MRVAPELAEWALFFAAGAPKRAAADAGLTRAVTTREADDLLRDVETFLGLVADLLGVATPAVSGAPPGQDALPLRAGDPPPAGGRRIPAHGTREGSASGGSERSTG